MIILNSSPVIHLTVALSGLDALPGLYGRVLVPEPVLRELESGAQLDDTARRLQTVSGLDVYALAHGVSPLLAGELDLGEAAVIHLALAPGRGVARHVAVLSFAYVAQGIRYRRLRISLQRTFTSPT